MFARANILHVLKLANLVFAIKTVELSSMQCRAPFLCKKTLDRFYVAEGVRRPLCGILQRCKAPQTFCSNEDGDWRSKQL